MADTPSVAASDPHRSAGLIPGSWCEVRPIDEILATLDDHQAIDGLVFMPEMARYCGQRFRVLMRAGRTCVYPSEVPFRRLDHAVTLGGLRCDGADHGGCQLGCMLLWREEWLRPVDAGGAASAPDVVEATPVRPPALRARDTKDSDRFVCQATELRKATRPGEPMWRPGQYVELLRDRSFTAAGLAGMLFRPARRRATRMLRSVLPRRRRGPAPGPQSLDLQPGELVRVRRRDEIVATLDARGMNRGLPFGGDMAEQCGREFRVQRRVERIVAEDTGRLRSVRDTVFLEHSICDRYLGCARGMPFMWREAWLERVGEAASVNATPPDPGAAATRKADSAAGRALKRSMDVVGASVALVVLSPVLAWVALAVAATQGLPILFRHERPGLREKPFTMLKFRTMRPPRAGEVWYLTDDQRISRLGRFLRSTSLDELPELWNVIKGDMSLVGPRPLLTEYLETYTPEQRRRHDVRPGITGWAAVNGRHALGFEDRLALDVWYVDHQSLLLDLKIMAMTLAQVVRRTDVSATQDLGRVGFPLPGVAQQGDRQDGP